MASHFRLAVVFLFAGCSPRVIDAVVADETPDGGGDAAREVGAVLEAASPDVSDAAGRKLLLHRYSFAGLLGNTTVADTGTAAGEDAIIYNAALSGLGYVELPGGPSVLLPSGQALPNPPYVDLPNFLVSRLKQATLEVWVSWNGTAAGDWSRIFDFGEDMSGADLTSAPRSEPGDRSRDGRSYLYLTPIAGTNAVPPNVLRLAYFPPEDAVPRLPGVTGREFQVSGTQALAAGLQQIDVTIDGQTMSLFVQGTLIGQTLLPGTLADIYDINCWLGRSQFPIDPLFAGRIYDFRVYDAALTVDQIRRNGLSTAAQPAIE